MTFILEPDYYDGYHEMEHTPPDTPNLHLPNGLLNVSSCKFDSAAYVSLPHFHLADPDLLDQFHPEAMEYEDVLPLHDGDDLLRVLTAIETDFSL